ncbi:MAG: hypothetical protein ACNS62_08385 [Candidatus Cyclobacteriaceae bacterium M3_2C_046]
MKKIVVILILFFSIILFQGCAGERIVIDGKSYSAKKLNQPATSF